VRSEPSKVRVALGQEEAGLLKAAAPIQVRLAEIGQPAWPATLERDPGAAVHRLPSAALGDTAGGRIATDPKDTQGLTAVHGVVLADVRLPVNLGERIGARAWVRFDHGHAPLVLQAARGFQQVFLRHFNPAQ
jgi:putative peptide zinc metalloprotease protein